MSQFTKQWKKTETKSFRESLRESIRPPVPLKPQLEQASRQVQGLVGKMDSTVARLKQRDASIFNKVTNALEKHDTQSGSALSNELAEIRKMTKMVSQAKVALEQIHMRLGTVHELGEIAATLAPVAGIVRSVRSGLSSVMPDAEHEIGAMGSILNSTLVEVGQLGGLTLNFEAANEDAERILIEASAVAEQKMKDKFPELQTSTGVSQQSTQIG